ncbi:MAG: TPM domain-containing protein [Calditrichaeota bacterium]|nr:TPM domain-containing protein [Calditrichota bacterium]
MLKNRSISVHNLLFYLQIAIILFNGLLFAEIPQQVPNPRATLDNWVTDLTGTLSAEEISQINAIISTMESQTSVEMAVVIIRQTDGRSVKEFATDLFNLWGVGKGSNDNGVLVLLSMGDRRIEVETGYGAEGVLPDGRVGQILDDVVIPRFRDGDFGRGLVDGVREMSRVLMRDPDDVRGFAESSREREFSLFPWLLMLSIGLVIVFVILRKRIERCPSCKQKMRLLSPEQEKPYLSADQQFEEEIGSIDYRVWHCDDCQTVTVKRKFMGGFSNCPKCKHRTLRLRTYVLQEPSYTREGTREIEQKCVFPGCGHQERKQSRIPKRVRQAKPTIWVGGPTSGRSGGFGSGGFGGGGGFSGGSFGGGSSGGGGAGRSF